jgi:hypothetical protein
VTAVALGACGHADVCCRCVLRLRLLYDDVRCALCKAENAQVVCLRVPRTEGDAGDAATTAGHLPPFEALMAGQVRTAMWQKPRWAQGVYVLSPRAAEALLAQQQQQQDDAPTASFSPAAVDAAARAGKPLHVALQELTARACPVCDRGCKRPFPTERLLEQHLRSAHGGRQQCPVCVDAGRRFPLELPALAPQALSEHILGSHMSCRFCERKFGGKQQMQKKKKQQQQQQEGASAAAEGEGGGDNDGAAAASQQHQQLLRYTFYGSDELYKHMNARHFECQLCRQVALQQARQGDCGGAGSSGGGASAAAAAAAEQSHVYMEDSRALAEHYASEHFACTAPECAGALVAFATEAELRTHALARHSQRMPRLDRSRARTVPIEAFVVVSSASAAAAANANNAAGGRGGRRGILAAAGAAAAAAAAAGREVGGGGLRLIDDDVGENYSMAEAAAAEAARRGADAAARRRATPQEQWPTLHGAAGGAAPAPPREAFPSLQAAAAAAAVSAPAPAAAAAAAPSSTEQPPPPAIVKATARCDCGRRVLHLAVRADRATGRPAAGAVPTLPCDSACEAQQRRGRLADAFGMAGDPNAHVPYFDRTRAPTYSAALLAAARADPDWADAVERGARALLADASKQRLALPPMPHARRALAHEYLSSAFGLVTQSSGQEPRRAVTIFKAPASGMPTVLLSTAALTAPLPPPGSAAAAAAAATAAALASNTPAAAAAAAAAAAVAAAPELTLRFVDVDTARVDLRRVLSRWDGHYTLHLTPQGGGGRGGASLSSSSCFAVVVFDKASTFQDASDTLGGGVRGQFRVERLPASAAAGSSAPVRPAVTSTRAALVVSPPPPPPPASAAAAADPGDGWTVAKKTGRGRRAGAAAAAAPRTDWFEAEVSTRPAPASSSQPAAAAAAAGVARLASADVADDWEQAAEEPLDAPLPPKPALKEARNIWRALGGSDEDGDGDGGNGEEEEAEEE